MTIGPFLIPPERLTVGLAALVFVLVVRLMSRRRDRDLRDWSFAALLIGFVAARAGFVLANADIYLGDPLSAFAVWQGGFSVWAGVAGMLCASLWHLRRAGDRLGKMVVALAAGWIAFSAIGPFARIGTVPPLEEVTLADLHGGAQSLGTGGPGHPTVINLWATWCPPCRRELPMMTQLAAGTEGVRFLFANQGESGTNVRRYLEAEGVSAAHVVLDPGEELQARYGTMGLPTTLFLDGAGTVVRAHVGEISQAAFRAALNELKEPAP